MDATTKMTTKQATPAEVAALAEAVRIALLQSELFNTQPRNTP